MRKSIASFFLVCFVAVTIFAVFPFDADAKRVKVRSYYSKDGTFVQSHYRTPPDGNPFNNYSFPGNYNPNTGKITTGDPQKYLDRYYNNSSSYSAPATNSNTDTFSTYSNGQGPLHALLAASHAHALNSQMTGGALATELLTRPQPRKQPRRASPRKSVSAQANSNLLAQRERVQIRGANLQTARAQLKKQEQEKVFDEFTAKFQRWLISSGYTHAFAKRAVKKVHAYRRPYMMPAGACVARYLREDLKLNSRYVQNVLTSIREIR